MEKVYAEAFLGKFLERLMTDTEREKAQRLFREHLVNPDLTEEYHIQYGGEIY